LKKLKSLLENVKLPEDDKKRVEKAKRRYHQWISNMREDISGISDPDVLISNLVKELNDYKFYLDVTLIFDSKYNFLYRQKGQLKLDNTVIEEFLPWLCNPVLIPEIDRTNALFGQVKAYSGIYFESTLVKPKDGGGLRIRTKNQDFAVSRQLWIKASHTSDYSQYAEKTTNLAYVATEIKTNLDKTMFQEAIGTAGDVKRAISGAKYFLVCDWLDMTPISTKNTPIDEVLILRHKRISSDRRKSYSSFAGRQAGRDWYIRYLKDYPYNVNIFKRFTNHLRKLLSDEEPNKTTVLEQGYF